VNGLDHIDFTRRSLLRLHASLLLRQQLSLLMLLDALLLSGTARHGQRGLKVTIIILVVVVGSSSGSLIVAVTVVGGGGRRGTIAAVGVSTTRSVGFGETTGGTATATALAVGRIRDEHVCFRRRTSRDGWT